MISLEIKLMYISCRSDMHIIIREWANYFYCGIETIFLYRILLDSNFNIFCFRIPVSNNNTFCFRLRLDNLHSSWIFLLYFFRWSFFMGSVLQLILWRLLIKVPKLNSRQIDTFYRFIFFIVIYALKGLVINYNLQRYEQISIKLQQSHIFHWRQGEISWSNIL